VIVGGATDTTETTCSNWSSSGRGAARGKSGQQAKETRRLPTRRSGSEQRGCRPGRSLTRRAQMRNVGRSLGAGGRPYAGVMRRRTYDDPPDAKNGFRPAPRRPDRSAPPGLFDRDGPRARSCSSAAPSPATHAKPPSRGQSSRSQASRSSATDPTPLPGEVGHGVDVHRAGVRVPALVIRRISTVCGRSLRRAVDAEASRPGPLRAGRRPRHVTCWLSVGRSC
jgi:hypothetical protein